MELHSSEEVGAARTVGWESEAICGAQVSAKTIWVGLPVRLPVSSNNYIIFIIYYAL